ncbi:DUF6988 family protein [Acidovorax facilis]|jgi:hypothetical protein|uniref:DUF6988 family protein n=1 Tax=Acidovorax facilis TaxID=12917 RepID=UPI003D647400
MTTSHADPSTDEDALSTLLDRSDEFEDAIVDCYPASGYLLAHDTQQSQLVAGACLLCIEHASVVRSAFEVDAPNSASGVLRLQYEALLRAAWLRWVANADQIAKLACDLDLASEKAAKNLPGLMDMLARVVQVGPAGMTAHLAEFNEYSRHALNSYVHTGIHPLRRVRDGFPSEMALALIRMSNGLMHLAYRMLAELSGSQRRMNRVTHLYKDFSDCCPMTPGWPNRDGSQSTSPKGSGTPI